MTESIRNLWLTLTALIVFVLVATGIYGWTTEGGDGLDGFVVGMHISFLVLWVRMTGVLTIFSWLLREPIRSTPNSRMT